MKKTPKQTQNKTNPNKRKTQRNNTPPHPLQQTKTKQKRNWAQHLTERAERHLSAVLSFLTNVIDAG